MTTSLPFYTYFHTRNDTGAVFYVGKGKGRRAYEYDRNRHWNNITAKHGRTVCIAAHWPTEAEAFQHEKFLILCFKDMGLKLANRTDGGEGSSGYKHQPEALMKMSAVSKGNKYALGHSVSQELKTLSSERNKGKTYCVGRKLSDETKKKIGLQQSGRSPGPETRAKISAANAARVGKYKHSDAAKLRMSEAAKDRKASPETKAKMSISASGRQLSEEARLKIKASWIVRKAKKTINS